MLQEKLEILNILGLHARAAAKLVSIASRYDCTVTVTCANRDVDARSIMGLLTLGAARGTLVEVKAEGAEESQAMAEIKELFARKFDEE